jgi:CHAT domain-containing protein
LHISTHGFADLEVPENSHLVFSPSAPDTPVDPLYLRELYDVDLHGVDLATLSACDTERGQMLRGEGAQAFSRALLMDGARSAITTLWRVDDQAASEFMSQFYFQALRRRETKAQALRSAKLAFFHSETSLSNPAHWAGFVLSGDGLRPLPHFISWRRLMLIPILIVFAIVAVYWLALRLRRRNHGLDRSQHVVAQ